MSGRHPYLALFSGCMLMLSLLGSINSHASNQEYDRNVSELVLTAVLNQTEDSLGRPLMVLGEQASLHLSFDVAGDEARIYRYTFVHCDYRWQRSELQPGEYLEGYFDDQITDYRFSLNTLTPYVHHELYFPTSYMQPKLSGNYLLVVFTDQSTEDQVLFTRRFFVTEPLLSLQVNIPQYNKLKEFEQTHHQLDVTVDVPAYLGNLPASTFFLNIMQDGRTDNMVIGLQPSQTYPDKLIYEYVDKTLFEGGNQWRAFDIKSFKYQSERIRRIVMGDDYFTVDLWDDPRRDRRQYAYEADIQGRKLIKARSDQDTGIEGDYAWVNFYLPWEYPLSGAEMHILGALVEWNIGKESRMRYNYQQKRYEASLFLKQGYYNYQYGIVEQGQSAASVALTEGTHWEANHDYFLCLYFRKPGSGYDQLISTAIVNSH